jgi:hypothetical protein
MCEQRDLHTDSWGQGTFLRGTNQGWVCSGNLFGHHRQIRIFALMSICAGMVLSLSACMTSTPARTSATRPLESISSAREISGPVLIKLTAQTPNLKLRKFQPATYDMNVGRSITGGVHGLFGGFFAGLRAGASGGHAGAAAMLVTAPLGAAIGLISGISQGFKHTGGGALDSSVGPDLAQTIID